MYVYVDSRHFVFRFLSFATSCLNLLKSKLYDLRSYGVSPANYCTAWSFHANNGDDVTHLEYFSHDKLTTELPRQHTVFSSITVMGDDSLQFFPQEILDSLVDAVSFAPWASTERWTTLGSCRLAGEAFNISARNALFQVVIIGSFRRWAERVGLLVQLIDGDPTLLKSIKRVGVLLAASYEECAAPLANFLSRIVDYPQSAITRFRIDDPRPFIGREPLKTPFIRLLSSGRIRELSLSLVILSPIGSHPHNPSSTPSKYHNNPHR